MRAVRLIEPGRPLEMQTVPVPTVGTKDVLVRVKAAGICHSDAHYRAGRSPVRPLPMTLGHEIAGVVEQVGPEVSSYQPGDRVCLHYMVTCGHCVYCNRGNEQFCTSGVMLGKYRDGGFADFCCAPERSVFRLPDEIPFEQGAVLMCSSATSLHALNKARLQPGETAAIFGLGGLGMAAVQLAKAFGTRQVFAVDIKPAKLDMARRFGATPVHAEERDPVAEIKQLTGGKGVDVAVELIGLPLTIHQAVQSLAIQGRAAVAGIANRNVEIDTYNELINKEAELIGVSDHLAQELPGLLEWARVGALDLSAVVSQTVPLEAPAINSILDRLEEFSDEVRVVVIP